MEYVNRIRALILAVLAFVAFSALGMFPKSISLHLPPQIQTEKTWLRATGFEEGDAWLERQEREPDTKKMPKKVFNKLHLLDDGNYTSWGIYNKSKDRYYISASNSSNNIKVDKDGKVEIKEYLHESAMNCMPVIKLGRYYYAFDQEYARVYINKKRFYSLRFDSISIDSVCNLLRKQETGKITLWEFCRLLVACQQRVLYDWNPKKHTAILVEHKDSEEVIYKVNVKEGNKEKMYTSSLAIPVSDKFAFCINNSVPYIVNFETGEEEIMKGLSGGLGRINFKKEKGCNATIFLENARENDETRFYMYDTKSKLLKTASINCPNNDFTIGKTGFVILSDGKFKFFPYDIFEEVK